MICCGFSNVKMFSNLCRTCLNKFHDSSDIVPLFKAHRNVFYYRICNELQLSVRQDDELGSNICKTCSETILTFYNFLLMYKESEKQLREMLNNQTMLHSLDTDENIDNKLNVVAVDQEREDKNHTTKKEYDLPCGLNELDGLNTKIEFHDIKIENTIDDDLEDNTVDDTKTFIPKEINDGLVDLPWKCTKCSSEFKTRRLLNIHNKIHLLNKPKKQWNCSLCFDKFPTRMILQMHRREQHFHERKPQSNETEFVCDICGKIFKTKIMIKQHLVTHNNDSRRKFLCMICGNQFCTKFGLKQHTSAIHDKEQKFQCAICERRFAHKQHLRTHMFRHEGKRPYPCTKCTKAFYDSSTLNVHTKSVHSNSNSYFCSICSKGFNRNGNLKIHMVKTHNLQKLKPQVSNKPVSISSK